MNNLIEIPENAKQFKAFLVGNSAGIKGNNHGTHLIGILSGPEFLFDDDANNHGVECEIIIIPKRILHTANTLHGDRVKYGDILQRAESMNKDSAWVEKSKKGATT